MILKVKKIHLIVTILLFTTMITRGQFVTQTGVDNLNSFTNDLAIYLPHTLNSPSTYGTVLGLRHWGGAGGSDWRTQLAFSTESDFYFRQSTNTAGTVWSEWKKIYNSENLNNNSTDFNAKVLTAKELIISQTQTNVLLSATSNSYINSGNFGIGTINPKNKLDVNGTIHSKEVKVDMENWSDFVFKENYNLPTLSEVEKHISEKGHLENIPSEKEVLQNGINLGEMNAKLLQKIEELTLYIIDLNKKLELQNQELNSVKKKLGN
ncbi:pyocin knob domain-containing protein [Flavobacterium tructae]|uniref:pyocin knob domain-containing protein n=1 Tax=Flavobacterium tructae TaxID=1114873 RepID=UPI0035A8B0CC